jgi:hypothetical protein
VRLEKLNLLTIKSISHRSWEVFRLETENRTQYARVMPADMKTGLLFVNNLPDLLEHPAHIKRLQDNSTCSGLLQFLNHSLI